jgi:hypothetical protein
MKQIFLLASFFFFMIACNTATETKDDSKSTETKNTGPGKIAATYSSSFETGDISFAEKAVQGSWKSWEANTMDELSSYFADTVALYYGDGTEFIGPKDSVIANWKRTRGSLTSVVDSVNAYTTVTNKDTKENWALLWVSDYSTDDKGVKDTTFYQETWRFNKDGKADLVYQYQRKRKK